ncbi:hypothetical protein Asn12ST33_00020 [Cutibacterium acnes]|nr:hypothetical protein Asn12ST33_00020 [Cutibacterium acnes]
MIRPGAASFGWSPDDFVYPQMRARQAPRVVGGCGFVLVVGVCSVCLAGSAGWFWDRGFVVSGLVW